jgi:hypothetical protein
VGIAATASMIGTEHAPRLPTQASRRNRVGEIARRRADHDRGARQFRPPYEAADFLFFL